MTALETILGFPTVMFTVLLGISLLYWLMVIFGALDMDSVGSADAEGALGSLGGKADGALGALGGKADGVLGGIGGKADGVFGGIGGKADGVLGGVGGKADGILGGLSGKADGLADGAVDGALDADGAIDGAAGKADGAFSLVSALNLRKAPVTVTLSVFALSGWGISALTMQALAPWLMAASIPVWLGGIPVFVASVIGSLLITSQAVKPFGRLFTTHRARGRSDLVGRVCEVTTGSVDQAFGQAIFDDRGSGAILQVRAKPGTLKRGDRALIIGWDDRLGGFVVEPMADLGGEVDRVAVDARFDALDRIAAEQAALEHAATQEALDEEAAAADRAALAHAEARNRPPST